jgi:biopolymer transport protein TolR
MRRYKHRSHGIINQMNVVPYIDVMLVLLVIFMITAPMFTPGVINLPKVGKAAQIITPPIQISILKDGTYTISQNKSNTTIPNLDSLTSKLQELLATAPDKNTPIVISADKDVKYDNVIQVVDKLYAAGIKKVALVVKQ